ncbi:MAG: hypothetical protein ACODAU_05250 [Myxococcota bacterium]
MMLRLVAPTLPLVGLLLMAAPAEVRACDAPEVRQGDRASWLAPDPPPPQRQGRPDWCERADDPRCMPGSQGTSSPEIGRVLLLRSGGVPKVPKADHRPCDFAPAEGLAPRAGVRNRVERPPRA